jgi:plastocyanin
MRAWTLIVQCLAGGIIGWSVQAQAQALVTDNGAGFSPDPVNIIAGQSVTWMDDGTGPYQIISDTGAWAEFSTPGGILFTQSGTYGYHDDVGDFGTVYVSPNLPPSVTITNPATNAVFSAPATFAFSADASDPDADGLSDVQFYVGTNLVDDVFSSPFATTVTNLSLGTYVLTAIAYDNLGATATNQITIYVQNPSITLTGLMIVTGSFRFDVSGLTIGKTNVIQVSTNLGTATSWASLATNVANSTSISFTNAAVLSPRFFRLLQLP